jgi:sulfotransferase
MDRHIHFISGLPRSGSTLLSALLQQNPRFHAGMSSPVAGMFTTLLGELSERNEFSVFIDDAKRQRILRGLFTNYYDGDVSADVVFDTNRTWCARLPALKTLFPNARIIACVRDTAWIVDSIERLIRNNAFQPSSIFNYQPGGTVYSRVEGLVSGDGMVGHAYNALKEAYFGEETGNLMLLQYDTLVNEPARALAAVYDFIGEPRYAHNFRHVSFDDQGFDQRAGTPGLHHVRARVSATARQTILPPDLFRRFENDSFWRDPQLNPRGVRIV